MKHKYLILIGLIAAAAFYLYQDKRLQQRLIGKVHQVAPELNRSTLYKWQNTKGEWQITDKPPSKGISFTTVNSQDQINVMPGASIENKK